MHVADQAAVHESLDIDAEPDRVWRAWTDPHWLAGWLAESSEGAIAPGASVKWRWDSLGVELELDVLECDPPRRLVLRGGRPGRPRQTQSVSLVDARGGTRVAIEHAGFAPDPAGAGERAGTAAGWRVALCVLAHYLAGRAGRRRECAAALAPLALPMAAVADLMHDAGGRAAWLVDGTGPPLAAAGERFAMLVGGERVSGHVLALAPPFQIALAWDEVDGVIALRAIELGPGGPVLAGLQAWSWSPERAAWRAARATLASAAARLVSCGGTAGALA